jgi:hypothetical protein
VIPASELKDHHAVELAAGHVNCLDSSSLCDVWQASESAGIPGDAEQFGTPGMAPAAPVGTGVDCEDAVEQPDGAGECAQGWTWVEAFAVKGPAGSGPGACARPPEPGEIVPTEIMVNGSAPCADKKDWVEVINLTADPLLLDGCSLADANEDPHTMHAPVVVWPGGYLVLLQAPSFAEMDAAAYFPFGTVPNLNADGDRITLACGETVIFDVQYGQAGTLPAPQNKTLEDGSKVRVAVQLEPAAGPVTAAYAFDPANWDAACQPTGCGDLASPGVANPACKQREAGR